MVFDALSVIWHARVCCAGALRFVARVRCGLLRGCVALARVCCCGSVGVAEVGCGGVGWGGVGWGGVGVWGWGGVGLGGANNVLVCLRSYNYVLDPFLIFASHGLTRGRCFLFDILTLGSGGV